jgi:hypothetical protein
MCVRARLSLGGTNVQSLQRLLLRHAKRTHLHLTPDT